MGSSLMEAGFSPTVFDATMRETRELTTYSLALAGANPTTLWMQARALRAALGRTGHKLDIAVYEFTPFQASAAHHAAKEYERGSLLKASTFADLRGLGALFSKSPEDAATIASLMVLGHHAPESVSIALSARVFELPGWWKGPSGAPPRRFSFRPGSIRWDEADRGEGPRYDGVEDAYRRKVAAESTPSNFEADRKRRIDSADILGLHFDEEFVELSIAALRELAAASRHVYLLLAPRNTAWIAPTAEAQARQDAVVRRLCAEGGATLVDFSTSPEFHAADFADTTHLTAVDGRAKFSRLLGERLRADRAPLSSRE
jgi:hypothetical protein